MVNIDPAINNIGITGYSITVSGCLTLFATPSLPSKKGNEDHAPNGMEPKDECRRRTF